MHRNFGPINTFDLESFSNETVNNKCDNAKLYVNTSIFSNANGSANVEYGETKVVATVYNSVDLKSEESLTVTIRYAPFAQKCRLNYVNDTDTRISKFIQSSLQSVIDFSLQELCKLEVHLLVLNDDGNSISAMLTCASLALNDAGVCLTDNVVGLNLLQHAAAAAPHSGGTATVTVAVLPKIRQIANIMSTAPSSLAQYEQLLRWDGPLKQALHMSEVIKAHLAKRLAIN